MAQKNKRRARVPLADRIAFAQQVDRYHTQHPGTTITDAIAALGWTFTEKNYFAWRKLAREDNKPQAQEFPLAIIPEKRAKKQTAIAKPRESDENKRLAASLLEVAARLLKR